MQLSNEVHNFARYCERLLSTVAVSRPLTEEEMRLVEYYCQEILTKVVTLQSNPQGISHSRNAHPSPDHSTSSRMFVSYTLACQLDLEGIVAKRAKSCYEENSANPNWIKIKNPSYSQKDGRADLFKRAG